MVREVGPIAENVLEKYLAGLRESRKDVFAGVKLQKDGSLDAAVVERNLNKLPEDERRGAARGRPERAALRRAPGREAHAGGGARDRDHQGLPRALSLDPRAGPGRRHPAPGRAPRPRSGGCGRSPDRDRRPHRGRQERPRPAPAPRARRGDRLLRQPAGLSGAWTSAARRPRRAERAEVPHHLLDVVDPDQPFLRCGLRAPRPRRSARRSRPGRGCRSSSGAPGSTSAPCSTGSSQGRPATSRSGSGSRRWPTASATPGSTGCCRASTPRPRPASLRATASASSAPSRSSGPPGSRSPSTTAAGRSRLRGFRTLIVGLDPGREELREAMEERTRDMLERGLLDEVRGLLRALPAPTSAPCTPSAIKQAVAVVQGRMSERGCERGIVTATLRFAKRQRTWFRHQAEVEWQRGRPRGPGDWFAAWLDRPPPSA